MDPEAARVEERAGSNHPLVDLVRTQNETTSEKRGVSGLLKFCPVPSNL